MSQEEKFENHSILNLMHVPTSSKIMQICKNGRARITCMQTGWTLTTRPLTGNKKVGILHPAHRKGDFKKESRKVDPTWVRTHEGRYCIPMELPYTTTVLKMKKNVHSSWAWTLCACMKMGSALFIYPCSQSGNLINRYFHTPHRKKKKTKKETTKTMYHCVRLQMLITLMLWIQTKHLKTFFLLLYTPSQITLTKRRQ